MCSIKNNKLYLQIVLAKEDQKQSGRMNEREKETGNKREGEKEKPLASQQIKPSAHLSAVTVTAHQCH